MKMAFTVLALLFCLLQFKLWFGEGGMRDVWHLKKAIAAQTAENQQLRERNESLAAEVSDLKQGVEAIEERARRELGMIKKGETFFQVVD
jgi:cell division protein FtsB